eukprot:2727507-Rhodomonas_salina.7
MLRAGPHGHGADAQGQGCFRSSLCCAMSGSELALVRLQLSDRTLGKLTGGAEQVRCPRTCVAAIADVWYCHSGCLCDVGTSIAYCAYPRPIRLAPRFKMPHTGITCAGCPIRLSPRYATRAADIADTSTVCGTGPA